MNAVFFRGAAAISCCRLLIVQTPAADQLLQRCEITFFKTFSAFPRTGVHHSFPSAEVPGGDGGLLHPVLREGHHRAVDHAPERYEVSAGPGGLILTALSPVR